MLGIRQKGAPEKLPEPPGEDTEVEKLVSG
jgi:hypothetical protein